MQLARRRAAAGGADMNFKESLLTSLSALLSNKLRSLLTMLGIIIGVAAVITMIAIGEGSQQAVMERIQALGSNLLFISPGAQRGGGATVIQRALTGVGVPTKVDGEFGLQTLANCNKPDALELLAELRAQAAVRYAQIIIRKPEEQEEIYERNLLGWMRRAVRP